MSSTSIYEKGIAHLYQLVPVLVALDDKRFG